MILVPDTTSEPTSTGTPDSTRSGLSTVNAIPPTTTTTTLSGTAMRKMRT